MTTPTVRCAPQIWKHARRATLDAVFYPAMQPMCRINVPLFRDSVFDMND